MAMCHLHIALFCRRKELGTVWSWRCPGVKSQAWPSSNCQGPAGVAGEVGWFEFSEQVKEQHLKSLRGPRPMLPGSTCQATAAFSVACNLKGLRRREFDTHGRMGSSSLASDAHPLLLSHSEALLPRPVVEMVPKGTLSICGASFLK